MIIDPLTINHYHYSSNHEALTILLTTVMIMGIVDHVDHAAMMVIAGRSC